MQISIRVADFSEFGGQLLNIRKAVFVEEQSVPVEIEIDGMDEASVHYIAQDSTGKILGCGRLLPSGQIGRMAVLRSSRGSGIGFQLLEFIVTHALESNFKNLFLHAQTHAKNFYERAGFVTHGDPFMEAGIEHVEMHYHR